MSPTGPLAPNLPAMTHPAILSFRQVLSLKASVPLSLRLPLAPNTFVPLRTRLPRLAASWADAAERRIQKTAAFGFQRVRLCLFTLFLLVSPLCACDGEDWSQYSSISFSLSHTATKPAASLVDLWNPAPADTAPGFSGWHGVDLFYPVNFRFVRTAGSATGPKEPVFGLFNKRLPSRNPSGAWAGMHAGCGTVFACDSIGRTRMTGAGLQDPQTAYVKLTFRF